MKRVRYLKNVKWKQETKQINEHATKHEIEELFRWVRSDGLASKTTKHNNKSEPYKASEAPF